MRIIETTLGSVVQALPEAERTEECQGFVADIEGHLVLYLSAEEVNREEIEDYLDTDPFIKAALRVIYPQFVTCIDGWAVVEIKSQFSGRSAVGWEVTVIPTVFESSNEIVMA